ncbi:hypothetical protein H7849_10970 [Alloacidobacterium dinghuense]|uniref:Uncharacterized protein n=1 Tax=Alloacidobacterium dinghuense TaxID=2763107 RepID=A0A7G8BP94_9BACT|nr:hypothetical protein [Alloacidobacterium dinghuense]QNI34364.1 hypothetical protein H7849_10970 [Alloacidobacterium dinghuense]
MRFNISVLCLWLVASASVCAAQAAKGTPALPHGTIYIEAQNMSFSLIDDVTLTVKRMNGFLIPRPGKIVSLDDKKSFTMQIENAKTYLSAENLSLLLNAYILPHAKTSIHDVTVHFEDQTLVVKGSVKKGLNVPFEGKGTLSVTPEGGLKLHFTDVKAAGVLKKGLLDALGITLASVAQPKHQPSFQIQGDDLIVSVDRLFPPPHVGGKLTSVEIDGDQLVEIFGQPNPVLKPVPVAADGYVYFRGGTVVFGKLTMKDVDLEIVNKDKTALFNFSLDHYREQLEAGYSKSLPNLGLVVYVADYSTIAPKKETGAVPKKEPEVSQNK